MPTDERCARTCRLVLTAFDHLQVAFGALFIAVPLGVGCAIYLSEYASPRLVAVVKPTLELLAGVPLSCTASLRSFTSVRWWWKSAITPLQGWIDAPPNVLNPINGAIVVGVMILPLVASMSKMRCEPFPTNCEKAPWRSVPQKSRPRST